MTRLSARADTAPDAGDIDRIAAPDFDWPRAGLANDDVRSRDFFRARMRAALDAGGAIVACPNDAGGVDALATIERLPWDSAQFGMACGRLMFTALSGFTADPADVQRVLASRAVSRARALGIQHLLVRLGPSRATMGAALEADGFFAVDTLLSFRHAVPDATGEVADRVIRVRRAEKADLPGALACVKHSFADTRFHRDARLRDKADMVYAGWVSNAVSASAHPDAAGYEAALTKAAPEVFVAELDDAIAGLMIAKTSPELNAVFERRVCILDLIAIEPSCQGRGVGAALMTKLLNVSRQLTCDLVEAATQADNHDARALYERFGFSLQREVKTLHGWLDQ